MHSRVCERLESTTVVASVFIAICTTTDHDFQRDAAWQRGPQIPSTDCSTAYVNKSGVKRGASTSSSRRVLQVLSAQPQRRSLPPSLPGASVDDDCEQAVGKHWRQIVVRCCEKLTTLDALPVTQSERTRAATLRRSASQDVRAFCKDIAGVRRSPMCALHAQHAPRSQQWSRKLIV